MAEITVTVDPTVAEVAVIVGGSDPTVTTEDVIVIELADGESVTIVPNPVVTQ